MSEFYRLIPKLPDSNILVLNKECIKEEKDVVNKYILKFFKDSGVVSMCKNLNNCYATSKCEKCKKYHSMLPLLLYSKNSYLEDIDKDKALNKRKELLFDILCENGLLFQRDFDLIKAYKSSSWQNHVLNAKYFKENIGSFNKSVNKAYIDSVHTLLVLPDYLYPKYKSMLKKDIKDFQSKCINLKKLHNFVEYIKSSGDYIHIKAWTKFMDSWLAYCFYKDGNKMYSRTIACTHYQEYKNAENRKAELQSLWQSSVEIIKSIITKQTYNKRSYFDISLKKCIEFLKKHNVNNPELLAQKICNRNIDSNNTILLVYNKVSKDIKLNNGAIIEKLELFSEIIVFFKPDLLDDNDSLIEHMYLFCTSLKVSKRFDWLAFIQKLSENTIINKGILEIAFVKLLIAVYNNLNHIFPDNNAYLMSGSIIIDHANLINIYKQKYHAQYIKTMSYIYKQIESRWPKQYKKVWDSPIAEKDKYTDFLRNRIYSIKWDCDALNDTSLWNEVPFINVAKDNDKQSLIEKYLPEFQMQLLEKALQNIIFKESKDKLLHLLITEFKKEIEKE